MDLNLKKLSDNQLLNAYLSGNENAITALVNRHRRRIFDYVHMMVKDRDVADDIFQETLIRVLRFVNDGRYTENGKFLSWVLRIAHNQVIDHFARRSSRTTFRRARPATICSTTRSSPIRPSRRKWCRRRSKADVRKLLDYLPKEQKEVVMMRYYMGLSFKEIAEQTEVSINTALGRMRYALINLRKLIDEKQLILN